MLQNNSGFRNSLGYTSLRMLTNFYMQSGGNIYTSMSSVCLENLEALSKKGVDMGVICNTVGNVYAGMSDTVRVVAASLSQSF